MSARRTRQIEGSGPTPPSDPAAARLLELLARSEGAETVDELRAQGIAAPGQAIYELQIAGYDIDRVTVHDDAGRTATGYRLRLPASEWASTEERVRQRNSPAHARRARRAERPAAVRPGRSRSQAAARPRQLQ